MGQKTKVDGRTAPTQELKHFRFKITHRLFYKSLSPAPSWPWFSETALKMRIFGAEVALDLNIIDEIWSGGKTWSAKIS